MRLKATQCLAVLGLLALAAPVWAHTDSATIHSDGTTIINGKELKPGDYQLKVEPNGSDLQVKQYGKVVTQVPVHWIQLPKKADATEVDLNKNQIVEVDFAGQTQAVKVQAN
ncbi:MAG TPA: hypothetical protein VMJ93_07420 [Verrucomicrobiae bacterium]|nr:hypothetical protein [Verrucomicrobiae bacterium]